MMEMIAVIAVIAVLATLAVPSYLERIVRDQVKESLPLADIAKQPIAAAWSATQSFPADNAAAGNVRLSESEIAALDEAFPRGPKRRGLPML